MMSLEPPLLLLLMLMCMVAAIAAVALSNCRHVVIYFILLKQGLARANRFCSCAFPYTKLPKRTRYSKTLCLWFSNERNACV